MKHPLKKYSLVCFLCLCLLGACNANNHPENSNVKANDSAVKVNQDGSLDSASNPNKTALPDSVRH